MQSVTPSAATACSTTARVRPAAPAPFTFRWPAGTVYTYGLSMESAGTIAPIETGSQDESAPLSATLVLEADLALRSYGRLDDRGDYVLGVRLARLTRLDWYLGPQPILADGGYSLVGPELALVVSPDGTFQSLNVTAEDSPLLVNLLRELLAPLQVVVSPGHLMTSESARSPRRMASARQPCARPKNSSSDSPSPDSGTVTIAMS